MYLGRVIGFDVKRGWGFIAPFHRDRIEALDSWQKEGIFVHYSDIVTKEERANLKKGQIVVFELKLTPAGLRAVNVKVVP